MHSYKMSDKSISNALVIAFMNDIYLLSLLDSTYSYNFNWKLYRYVISKKYVIRYIESYIEKTDKKIITNWLIEFNLLWRIKSKL